MDKQTHQSVIDSINLHPKTRDRIGQYKRQDIFSLISTRNIDMLVFEKQTKRVAFYQLYDKRPIIIFIFAMHGAWISKNICIYNVYRGLCVIAWCIFHCGIFTSIIFVIFTISIYEACEEYSNVQCNSNTLFFYPYIHLQWNKQMTERLFIFNLFPQHAW